MDQPEKPADPPKTVFGEYITPAFANQFHVSALGGMVRIVFGEVILGAGNTFFPHNVIVIPEDRAAELAALIGRVLKAVEDARKQPSGSTSG